MATLTIVAQKEDGTPIDDVTIKLWRAGGCDGTDRSIAITWDGGKATFGRLEIDTTVYYRADPVSGYQDDTCHSRTITSDSETITLTLYPASKPPADFSLTDFSVGASSSGGKSSINIDKGGSFWLVAGIENIGGTTGTVYFTIKLDGVYYDEGSMILAPNDTGYYRKQITLYQSGTYTYCIS